MRTMLDIGKRGAESVDIESPTPAVHLTEGIEQFEPIIRQFKTEAVEVDTDSGIKKTIRMHRLLVDHPMVFGLLFNMAPYEPIVYARKGQQRAVLGMISPNYDETGSFRRPSISVLPLIVPRPLILSGNDLLPDAETATMLAGSAHAEGPGVGSHNRPPLKDYEDNLTIIGAVSLDKNTILDKNGNHTHLDVRRSTSVANGLTNGTLGNVFQPDGDKLAGFGGYGMPLVFEHGSTQHDDAILIPEGFLQKEQAYGVYYKEASKIALGATLGIMYERQGQQEFTDKLRRIAEAA